MPTYEFRCPRCEKTFDVFCKMDERDDPRFCECGATAERVLNSGSAPAVYFHGRGWARVDKNYGDDE